MSAPARPTRMIWIAPREGPRVGGGRQGRFGCLFTPMACACIFTTGGISVGRGLAGWHKSLSWFCRRVVRGRFFECCVVVVASGMFFLRVSACLVLAPALFSGSARGSCMCEGFCFSESMSGPVLPSGICMTQDVDSPSTPRCPQCASTNQSKLPPVQSAV